MNCVSTPRLALIWNGERTEYFNPSRGTSQGNPLSPYLFVLYMEKLAHLIQNKVANREWIQVKAPQGGPLISHLFFDDDLVLFSEATVSQAQVVLECLKQFCEISGSRGKKLISRSPK